MLNGRSGASRKSSKIPITPLLLGLAQTEDFHVAYITYGMNRNTKLFLASKQRRVVCIACRMPYN